MPEFQLDYGGRDGGDWFRSLDSFTQGYVEAMFFTSTGSGDDGELETATVSDLSPSARAEIIEDCKAFQKTSAYIGWLESDPEMGEDCAGRDFWYTRNGHGVGFWEESRGYGVYSEPLDTAAKAAGEINLCRGDDGFIYT